MSTNKALIKVTYWFIMDHQCINIFGISNRSSFIKTAMSEDGTLKAELNFEKQLADVESNFTRYIRARRNSIDAFRSAAKQADKIAEVTKGLKVGGGVTAVIGNF